MSATSQRRVVLALGVAFVVLFLVVQGAVLVQATRLSDAQADYEATATPITDLANTQRQAERLRSAVIAGDPEQIELEHGLLRRQLQITLSPSRRDVLGPELVQAVGLAEARFDQFLATHGLEEALADPVLEQELQGLADEVSRTMKLAYDREEQQFLDRMLRGMDTANGLSTVLLVLGAMTLLVGVAFAIQLLRRTRQSMAEANDRLRAEVAERIAGERRLAVAFQNVQASEARARAAAAELETLHQVVLAGLGGGAEEVATRVADELVHLHDFDGIAVVLRDRDGSVRVAAAAGGNGRKGVIDEDGPVARVLQRAPAQQVEVGPGLSVVNPDTRTVQVAPIHAGRRLLGAVVVENCSDEPTLHLEAVQRLADQLGLVFEAARGFDDQRLLAERFRELDELKTEFVATVSHELRTPLTAIVGMALTLDKYWERVTDEERRDMVARMRRQARRQQRLVDDLLTISRIQQKGLHRRAEVIDIRGLVRSVRQDLDVSEVGEHVSVDVPPGLSLWADRDHVERILTNYLTNARKYAGDAAIVIGSRRVEEGVELWVQDHGPGVPEDFQERLFDRFTQASSGTTRTAQGVGLGLSIVQTLAEANRGRAWFRPTEGGGAVFGVTLPARPATPEPVATQVEADDASAQVRAPSGA